MHKLLYPLTVFLLAGSLLAADPYPFVGAWKLNLAKSKFGGPIKLPKEQTLVIQNEGDQQVMVFKGIAADGSPISSKFALPMTGGEEQVLEGAPSAGTSVIVAKRKSDARSFDTERLRDGKVVGTSHVVVSDDGKTMQQTSTRTDTQGNHIVDVWWYDKQ